MNCLTTPENGCFNGDPMNFRDNLKKWSYAIALIWFICLLAHGNEMYRFIDHPNGYSYEELMSMPPPEFKDMTVSEVFHTIQQVEEVPSKEDIINSIIEENTPAILKIEFTADLTSDEEDEEQEDQEYQEE